MQLGYTMANQKTKYQRCSPVAVVAARFLHGFVRCLCHGKFWSVLQEGSMYMYSRCIGLVYMYV